MSLNALRSDYNPKRVKQLVILHQIMEADNYESFLWEDDISNYKKYPIDKIAAEMIWLAPFRSNGLRVLKEYVEKRLAITKRVKWKRERTKPHRGDLHKAINRQFIKWRNEKRRAKKEETIDNKLKIVSNKIQVVANEFDMELTKTIYNNKIPKTDAAYKEDQKARIKTIAAYKRQGDYEFAQVIEDKPLNPEPTYREVAYSLKGQYLQKHSELPKQRLEKALSEMIKETNKFAYPKRKYTYPTDEDQPEDDF